MADKVNVALRGTPEEIVDNIKSAAAGELREAILESALMQAGDWLKGLEHTLDLVDGLDDTDVPDHACSEVRIHVQEVFAMINDHGTFIDLLHGRQIDGLVDKLQCVIEATRFLFDEKGVASLLEIKAEDLERKCRLLAGPEGKTPGFHVDKSCGFPVVCTTQGVCLTGDVLYKPEGKSLGYYQGILKEQAELFNKAYGVEVLGSGQIDALASLLAIRDADTGSKGEGFNENMKQTDFNQDSARQGLDKWIEAITDLADYKMEADTDQAVKVDLDKVVDVHVLGDSISDLRTDRDNAASVYRNDKASKGREVALIGRVEHIFATETGRGSTQDSGVLEIRQEPGAESSINVHIDDLSASKFDSIRYRLKEGDTIRVEGVLAVADTGREDEEPPLEIRVDAEKGGIENISDNPDYKDQVDILHDNLDHSAEIKLETNKNGDTAVEEDGDDHVSQETGSVGRFYLDSQFAEAHGSGIAWKAGADAPPELIGLIDKRNAYLERSTLTPGLYRSNTFFRNTELKIINYCSEHRIELNGYVPSWVDKLRAFDNWWNSDIMVSLIQDRISAKRDGITGTVDGTLKNYEKSGIGRALTDPIDRVIQTRHSPDNNSLKGIEKAITRAVSVKNFAPEAFTQVADRIHKQADSQIEKSFASSRHAFSEDEIQEKRAKISGAVGNAVASLKLEVARETLSCPIQYFMKDRGSTAPSPDRVERVMNHLLDCGFSRDEIKLAAEKKIDDVRRACISSDVGKERYDSNVIGTRAIYLMQEIVGHFGEMDEEKKDDVDGKPDDRDRLTDKEQRLSDRICDFVRSGSHIEGVREAAEDIRKDTGKDRENFERKTSRAVADSVSRIGNVETAVHSFRFSDCLSAIAKIGETSVGRISSAVDAAERRVGNGIVKLVVVGGVVAGIVAASFGMKVEASPVTNDARTEFAVGKEDQQPQRNSPIAEKNENEIAKVRESQTDVKEDFMITETETLKEDIGKNREADAAKDANTVPAENTGVENKAVEGAFADKDNKKQDRLENKESVYNQEEEKTDKVKDKEDTLSSVSNEEEALTSDKVDDKREIEVDVDEAVTDMRGDMFGETADEAPLRTDSPAKKDDSTEYTENILAAEMTPISSKDDRPDPADVEVSGHNKEETSGISTDDGRTTDILAEETSKEISKEIVPEGGPSGVSSQEIAWESDLVEFHERGDNSEETPEKDAAVEETEAPMAFIEAISSGIETYLREGEGSGATYDIQDLLAIDTGDGQTIRDVIETSIADKLEGVLSALEGAVAGAFVEAIAIENGNGIDRIADIATQLNEYLGGNDYAIDMSDLMGAIESRMGGLESGTGFDIDADYMESIFPAFGSGVDSIGIVGIYEMEDSLADRAGAVDAMETLFMFDSLAEMNSFNEAAADAFLDYAVREEQGVDREPDRVEAGHTDIVSADPEDNQGSVDASDDMTDKVDADESPEDFQDEFSYDDAFTDSVDYPE